MEMENVFAILRTDKQLQGPIHDFALCFQAREFLRLANQGFINIDISASHENHYTPVLTELVYRCGFSLRARLSAPEPASFARLDKNPGSERYKDGGVEALFRPRPSPNVG
jgi:hypothetical protein